MVLAEKQIAKTSLPPLGPTLVSLIWTLAAGSLVILLVVTAVPCIILGMGMPTTVTVSLALRVVGLVLFTGLTIKNRRQNPPDTERTGEAEPV